MIKIFKLFKAENIKTWKKFSTKLSIIIILLSIIGVLFLVKFIKYLDENIVTEEVIVEQNNESLKLQIEDLNNQLKNENLDEMSKESIQNQIEQYKLIIENNISINSWKNDLIISIIQYREEGNIEKANELIEIIKNNNFSKYIEFQKQLATKGI